MHSLAPLDEDELLRRLELHIGDLPEGSQRKKLSRHRPDRETAVSLSEAKLAKEHPEILDHLMMKEKFLKEIGYKKEIL